MSSNLNIDTTVRDSSRPVLIMNSVLAGLQVIIGGSALADVLPVQVYGILALVFAGVQIGWGRFVEGSVTPWKSVVARSVDGQVLAGPAAQASTDTPVVVVDAAEGEVVAPPVVDDIDDDA